MRHLSPLFLFIYALVINGCGNKGRTLHGVGQYHVQLNHRDDSGVFGRG